jgi:hypothetical protein
MLTNLSLTSYKDLTAGAGHRGLTHVILVTQEVEIRRIMVQSQPRQLVQETLS